MFEDRKSIGNLLRVSAIQCALRTTLQCDNLEEVDVIHIRINLDDVKTPMVLVKYSVNCLIAIDDSLKKYKTKLNF